MSEKISIIVPVYNVEKELERCVNSLVNQTYSNLEIILVDDGATDASGKIADQFQMNHPEKIKVIHQKNAGVSAARNTGIDAATGAYLSFVDSDDFLERDAMAVMHGALDAASADIAICGRYDDYPDKSVVSLNCKEPIVMDSDELMGRILTWDDCDGAVCDKLFRAELWVGTRFPVGRSNNEDFCTIPKIVRKSRWGIHVAKPLYHYCHREGSATTSYSLKKVVDCFRTIGEMSSMIQKDYQGLEQELCYFNCHSYLNIWVMCDRIGYRGPELQEAKAYLKEHWNDPYSKQRMSKQNKMLYLLLRLRLFGAVRAIKRMLLRG